VLPVMLLEATRFVRLCRKVGTLMDYDSRQRHGVAERTRDISDYRRDLPIRC
jgi:hypothetical protein